MNLPKYKCLGCTKDFEVVFIYNKQKDRIGPIKDSNHANHIPKKVFCLECVKKVQDAWHRRLEEDAKFKAANPSPNGKKKRTTMRNGLFRIEFQMSPNDETRLIEQAKQDGIGLQDLIRKELRCEGSNFWTKDRPTRKGAYWVWNFGGQPMLCSELAHLPEAAKGMRFLGPLAVPPLPLAWDAVSHKKVPIPLARKIPGKNRAENTPCKTMEVVK